MSGVFADSLFWIAIANPLDPWAEAARQAHARLPKDTRLVTTEEVMCEFLTAFCESPHLRGAAVRMLKSVQESRTIELIEQSHASFGSGVDMYHDRPDKHYSLVDCISMHTMRERGIRRVLTNDHHFTQEGFQVLIQR